MKTIIAGIIIVAGLLIVSVPNQQKGYDLPISGCAAKCQFWHKVNPHEVMYNMGVQLPFDW